MFKLCVSQIRIWTDYSLLAVVPLIFKNGGTFRYVKHSNSSGLQECSCNRMGITRVADATAQAYAGKFNLMSSENTSILNLNLRRYNDNLIGSGQCVSETERT